jgi:hypothetical protein
MRRILESKLNIKCVSILNKQNVDVKKKIPFFVSKTPLEEQKKTKDLFLEHLNVLFYLNVLNHG